MVQRIGQHRNTPSSAFRLLMAKISFYLYSPPPKLPQPTHLFVYTLLTLIKQNKKTEITLYTLFTQPGKDSYVDFIYYGIFCPSLHCQTMTTFFQPKNFNSSFHFLDH